MQTRTLRGLRVFVHQNNGLRKRCGCPRRAWARCSHPWHFSFKWRGVHHRFPLDRYATEPITDKDKARTEADRLRAAIRAGTFPPPAPTPAAAPSDVTFAAFGALWLERGRADASEVQRSNDRSKLARLGALTVDGSPLALRPIGRITEDDIEQAFAGLAGSSGSTWNKYRQTVLHLQRWGRKKGYLTGPWLTEDAEIARRKPGKRARRLQPGEEVGLLAGASAWLQRLIIAALETCCRQGELLSLQWQDVDLHRARFTVRAEKAKSGTSRILPILPRFRAVLDLIRLDPADQPHGPTAYVFGNAIGERVGSPKKGWESAVLKAHGHTPEWVKGKLSPASRALLRQIDLHFHDLRHEAGSRLLEAGWPLQHVQGMLGHADAKTTSIYLNADFHQLADSARRFLVPPTGEQPLHNVAHDPDLDPRPAGNADPVKTTKALVN